MIEKQFGTQYGPALSYADKVTIWQNFRAEIERRGCVPYGWLRIYETLLFSFYNSRSGDCFPSHRAVAAKAGCSERTVRSALKWAQDNSLIMWAHGLVRSGWRVFRTSNRYAFAAFLTVRRVVSAVVSTTGKLGRRITTLYRSLAEIAAEARSFSFPTAPCQLQVIRR